MTLHQRINRSLAFSLLLLLSCFGVSARAQETITVITPTFVTFNVSDVSQTSSSAPSSVTVSFSGASLSPGMSLSISVMPDANDFTPPSGLSVPASKVSWTAGGASGGSGYSGTLSGASFTEVYRSSPDPSSGSVDLTFTLDAPGAGIYAGDHSLNLIWKFESVL